MTGYLKTKAQKKRRGVYFKCETCGEEFYVFPSYLRKSQKAGIQIRFCSMKCYDKKGENNPFWGKKHKKSSIKKMVIHPNRSRFGFGEDNPNFVRFGEDFGFRGKSKLWWQRKFLNEDGKCERCGFSDKRALCIHHKDKNPKNNSEENLELLCWNCHQIWHYEDKSGIYKFLKMGSSNWYTTNRNNNEKTKNT